MITTRKFKLAIVSDNKNEAYSFIRNEMREQSRALNIAYSHLYFEYMAQQKIKNSDEDYKEQLTKYKETAQKKYDEFLKIKEKSKEDETLQPKVDKAREAYNKAQQKVYKVEKDFDKKAREIYQKAVGLPKQTRIRKLLKREFNLHYDTEDRVGAKVIADFNTDVKAGVFRGERSLRNYKSTHPLMVRTRSLKLYQEKGDFYLKWINGITFKVIVSISNNRKANIQEIKHTLNQIMEGIYTLKDSSISLNKDLMLHAVIDIPITKQTTFIPGRVVGVDLGIKNPAYVSLSDKPYIRQRIGDIDKHLHERTKIQKQHKRLKMALTSVKGGKGRKKKLRAEDRFKKKERRYINTYNHFLSRSIINFALKYQAGVIHMEELKFDRFKNKSVLRNWSYYELQEFVENKAKREGIEVCYVDSRNTSKACSKCGNLEEGQRKTQELFICNQCGFEANADYNASQNIAKSTKFVGQQKNEIETNVEQLSLQL